MASSSSVAESQPAASPAHIAATGFIPSKWSVEIRKRARHLACPALIPAAMLTDDLERVARTALWLAARAYDATRGVAFEHYARRAIHNAMVSELRFAVGGSGHRTSRLDDLGNQDSQAILTAREDERPDELYELRERRDRVRSWLSACPPRVRRVFELIYEQGLNQRQAAAAMKISQPRVCHYHRQLLELGHAGLVLTLAA